MTWKVINTANLITLQPFALPQENNVLSRTLKQMLGAAFLKRLYHWHLDFFFLVLEDVSPYIKKASSFQTDWWGT